jgi:transposase
MQHREPYQSDVSDREWQIIRQLFPQRSRLGRPPRYQRREVFNAIMYVTKTGCPWRDLPHDLPPWRLCYHYFASWEKLGLWQRLNDALREKVRQKSAKKKPPRRPSSIRKRLRWLTNPENVATMLARRWRGASVTSWSTPSD